MINFDEAITVQIHIDHNHIGTIVPCGGKHILKIVGRSDSTHDTIEDAKSAVISYIVGLIYNA